ncbi:hypothetical protein Dimus_027267 [Dionaea muscipula]
MVEVLARNKPDLLSTEALTKKLQDHMGGAKYLLMLDDVWNTVEGLWEALKTCLHRIGGSSGSKVLVTTCINVVADAVKAPVVHTLKGLANVHSWALFKHIVFSNGEACPSNLAESGRKIVDKCNGVPLAIKTLGATLRLKRNLQDWKSIENSELWKLSEFGDRIMLYLLLSFQHLPFPYLKQCFAYYSIYQKGAAISKDELICLWMAQGLLFLQEGSNLKMEKIDQVSTPSMVKIISNRLCTIQSFVDIPKDLLIGMAGYSQNQQMGPPLESFPCLEKLKIVGCPRLTITPTGFSSLRHLELRQIKSALLSGCYSMGSGVS